MRKHQPGPKPELEKEVVTLASTDISDDDYVALLSALKQQAMSGDAVARRQLIELHNASKAAKGMDFVLEITPYDIEDKKLGDIIQQADVPTVLEIMKGLRGRLEADNFSETTQKTLRSFVRLFEDEAIVIYAPAEQDGV